MPARGPLARRRASLRLAHRAGRKLRVDHRRQQDLTRQQRRTLIARHQGQRRGQIAAGLFAGNVKSRLLAGPFRLAARDECQHVEGDFEGLRKRMLGRERIIDGRDDRTGLRQQRRDHAPVIEAAGNEGTTVEMEHDRCGPRHGARAIDANADRLAVAARDAFVLEGHCGDRILYGLVGLHRRKERRLSCCVAAQLVLSKRRINSLILVSLFLLVNNSAYFSAKFGPI